MSLPFDDVIHLQSDTNILLIYTMAVSPIRTWHQACPAHHLFTTSGYCRGLLHWSPTRTWPLRSSAWPWKTCPSKYAIYINTPIGNSWFSHYLTTLLLPVRKFEPFYFAKYLRYQFYYLQEYFQTDQFCIYLPKADVNFFQ